IDDARLVQIVRRHLDLHAVARRQTDETLAHFARDMGEHEVLVGEFDTEHRPGEHRGNFAFCFNSIIYTHNGTTDDPRRAGKLTRERTDLTPMARFPG